MTNQEDLPNGSEKSNSDPLAVELPINKSIYDGLDIKFDLKTDNPHNTVMVWGTQSSGKTTFLSRLYMSINNENSSWSILGYGTALTWSQRIAHRIYIQKTFPDATPPGIHYSPRFDIMNKAKHQKKIMHFIDATGEMFLDPINYSQRRQIQNPVDFMKKCGGILMLIDPTKARNKQASDDYAALLKTLEHLSVDETGNPQKLMVPVAFCLTKCDEYLNREAFGADFDPDLGIDPPESAAKDFAREYFPQIIGFVDDRINNKKWYACSALGFKKNEPTNTFPRFDGKLGIRDIGLRPINLIEPIDWLFQQMGYN